MVDYSVYLESRAVSIGSQASLVRNGKDPESRLITQASHQPTPRLSAASLRDRRRTLGNFATSC